jgi:uncharacterized protein (DUF4415 family)
VKKKKIDLSGYSDDPVDDPDSPELTADIIRRMRPMREVNPEFVKRIEEMRKRGRPPLEHPKVQVTLRLDEEVVKAFREDGPGWQSRINEELKKTLNKRAKK